MTTSKKSTFISTFATLLSLVVLARPSAAQSYNAAGDFSIGSNPNSAWSYGYSYGVGSAVILDTTSTNPAAPNLPLSGWLGNENPSPYTGYPSELHNGTANIVTDNFTTVYKPGQLGLQPGDSNEVSIVRWTAPFSGTFSINATFSGLDSLGDSVDVHILHNGSSLFNSVVSPSPASYSGLQSVIAGDTIDFVVGNGGNGLNDDTTALSASIVPEPGTLGLVGMGLACLLSFRFLKRK
jgi:hypothetical protein